MDTFMDKLAQKLTAQEMIKANSAADAEELRRLKGQIEEYNECLARMQKANDEMRSVNSELEGLVSDRLVSEIDRLSGIASDDEQLRRITEESVARLEQITNSSIARLENARIDTAQIDRLVGDGIDRMRKLGDEALAKLQEIQAREDGDSTDELKQTVSEKIESVDDFVHRECVKVYRNVQSVITEENGKQNETVNEAVKALKGKLGVVMGISVAALLFSIAGVVLQILALI
ncbi:MAG: hypothetical protein LUG83_02115 [Lachnospiraceae bacterium]|nr:hypothetical protein [Lachnospiraceae bacterium]